MTDPSAGADDLVVTRILDAPRPLVFRCMTDPEHLTHFWGPRGMRTPREGITVDARPGGTFETVMVNDSDGSTYTMRAVYVEISEPERLVWRDLDTGVTTTSTFVDLGGSRTELRIHQANVPAAFRTPQARAGFATSLDRFASHLQTVIAEPPPETGGPA